MFFRKIFLALFMLNLLAVNTWSFEEYNKVIIGSTSDYYFKIPISWERYVTYSKENVTEDYLVDKINFYYTPRDKGNYKNYLLTLYVYKKGQVIPKLEGEFLLETSKYIFTKKVFGYNPYDTSNDKIIFERFLNEVENNNFLANKLVIAGTTEEIQSNTITLNRKKLNKKALKINNDTYLPLREISERLGYSVKWDNKTKSAILNDKIVLSLNDKIYQPKIINNRLYVKAMFMTTKLKLNLEVDGRNNVKIRSIN